MGVYLAVKDGMQFYIQPDMLEAYYNMGYEIYKEEPVKVTNIKAEMESIEPSEVSGETEGVNG